MGTLLLAYHLIQAQTILWKRPFSAMGSGMTQQEAATQIFSQVRKEKKRLEKACQEENGKLDSKLERLSCQRQGDFYDCVGFLTFTCTAIDNSEEPG